MARLIPPVLEETKSPGEKELFQELRKDESTAEWIVLHSLDIAQHRSQISGEADFVLIVPGLGVLVVEVKAHLSIERIANGGWIFGKNGKAEFRGPFKQAADAMHSIREKVHKHSPRLRGVPFWSAACFPYVSFEASSPEWHEWQVIDKRTLSRRSFAAAVADVLTAARAHLSSCASAAWFHPGTSGPSAAEVEEIAKILRPRFEFFESPKARFKKLDSQLRRYTADQLKLLDLLAPNERVLTSAPAGTGKTMLAIEAARRDAAAGKRVLLLCYNNLLGAWLRDQIDGLPGVRASTMHAELLRLSGSSKPEKPPRDYWEKILPDRAVDRLLQDGNAPYDSIVVDEAQDLMRAAYLDCFELMVDGGLKSGRWLLFGDFEKQSIYGMGFSAVEEQAQKRLGGAARCRLRTNCRNTPRIAERVHLLGGLSPHYDTILRPDDDVEPTITYYSSPEEQEAALSEQLQDLISNGCSLGDIVVLSPVTDSAAAALSTRPRWKGILCPFGSSRPNAISYGTVHAFKGLESPAVVLTDVQSIESDEARSLLYIGASRALHRLAILAAASVKASVRSALISSV